MFAKLKRLLVGTLRRQLIIGMTLVVAAMMSLSIFEQTRQAREQAATAQAELVSALARSVAVSSAVWVASRDYAGLQEIVSGLKFYPDLRHVVVLDRHGKVLAHSDPTRRGMYMSDLPKVAESTVLQRAINLTDIASPVMLSGLHIGWVRIGIAQNSLHTKLATIVREGIFFALMGVVLSALIAALAGRHLTRRLAVIQKVTNAVRAGQSGLRAELSGDDEAAQLARQFNAMLDALEREMTERKRADAAVKESEARFRATFEQAAVGMGLRSVDPRHPRWLRVNQKLCDILRYTHEELLQTSSVDVTPPEDRAEAIQYNERLLSGELSNLVRDKRYVRKDGTIIWAKISVSVIRDTHGQPIHFISAIEDITERKQTQLALQQQTQSLGEIIWVTNIATWEWHVQTGVTIFNERWAQIVGYTLEELAPVSIDTWGKLVHPDDAKVSGDLLARCFSRELDAYNCEARMRHKDGHWVWVSDRGRVVEWAADGKPLRMAGTHQDITERKQAEQARRALEAQLRESQKMEAMGVLAGGVAHDFNNIIATILGNTALAKMDVRARPDDVVLSLEEIDKAAKRAKNLVQQILTFSRRSEQTFVAQPVRPLVEESMKLLRSTIPRGVEFVAKFAETPLYASVDSTQIEQVLINLCTNACHAMKDGAGRIEIEMAEVLLDHTAAQRSPDLHTGQYVRLSVSDNGSGMDAATQARIFEPFFTTKGVGLGTGLGLSVVHGIVKSHQGAITVESAPSKGTTFAVYLPAVAAPAETERVADDAPVDAAPALSTGQVEVGAGVGVEGKRVLYVDDDESLALLVQRVFTQMGFRANGYMAGPDAVAAVRADPLGFDLVVSDYNMSGMSGLDVATQIRSIRPDLPVVIFSGFVTDQLRAAALQIGVREVISKANTVDEMCQRIQKLLSVQAGRG